MERGEPTLVPEWYKGSTGSASASGNSNHRSQSSLHSDRSFRRSTSSNGSMTHDRLFPSNLRPYSSFGRSHRDKDREKDHDLFENRSRLAENGLFNYADSVIGNRNDRGTLRHTPSLVGKQVEALSKRPSSSLSSGVMTGASAIRSISRHSFEKEFPSLGVEERQPDVARVSSPGLTTAMDNLSRISPAAIVVDGWTSALAEVPVRAESSGSTASSTMQTTSSSATSTAFSSSTGLNMAETVAQAPLHARPSSQASVDTQKIEEFTRLQYSKLVPMKPSMPKSLALNSLEKSKSKGVRSGEYNVQSKVGLQSSSQPGHTIRAPARSDTVKMSQTGNLQVLNREKNGITILRDGLNLQSASKVVVPPVGDPTVVNPSPKTPANPKQELDDRSGFSSPTRSNTCGEKRPKSQVQNRNEFFNFIRQNTSLQRSLDPSELRSVSQEKENPALCTDLECSMESGNDDTADNNIASVGNNRSILSVEDETTSSDLLIARSNTTDIGEKSLLSNPAVLKCVSDTRDETLSSGSAVISRTVSPAVNGDVDSSPDSVVTKSIPENVDEISPSDPVVPPSEEEVAFLRRLGWDENADGDALTPDEINYFYQKHPEQKASSRLGYRKSH